MSNFASRLKSLRKNKGLTQSELAKNLSIGDNKISASAIGMWEQGRRTPKLEILELIADYFNVDLDYLRGSKDTVSRYNQETNKIEETAAIKWNGNVNPIIFGKSSITVPVLGSVPAGVPVEAIEDIAGSIKVASDFMNTSLDHFALKVKGDSMYPKYVEGDIIIVEIKHDCESGEDAIVYVNGYDATLKTVIKNDDSTITLKPRNPEWPSKTYGPDDEPLSILGPVVQQIRTP